MIKNTSVILEEHGRISSMVWVENGAVLQDRYYPEGAVETAFVSQNTETTVRPDTYTRPVSTHEKKVPSKDWVLKHL